MGELNINYAQASNLSTAVTDASVSSLSVDGVKDQDETYYYNTDWTKYWGYFNEIPDLKSAMLMKAIWDVGKGYDADPETSVILDHISGWGKDTFDDILFNMDIVMRIGGDSFAEITRDKDTGIIINLKPLDPETIKIVVGRNGRIKRYEQTSKMGKGGVIKFEPEDIFHLSNNRLADQIHGISDIKSMETTILAEKESFADNKLLMHHQARPMIVFKLGTDNPAKIAEFAAKMDAAVNKAENIYVPDDVNSFSFEVVQVNPSQVVMEWRNDIRNKFYRALGMPLIIFGQAGQTESGGKIEYTGHEQVWEHSQRFLEKQIWNQLNLRINLISPISLLDNLLTDEQKDKNQGMEIQPQDMTAGKG